MFPPFCNPVKDSLTGGQIDLLSARLITQQNSFFYLVDLTFVGDGDSWVNPITCRVSAKQFLFRIRFGLLFRWRGTLLVFSLSFRANCKSRHTKKKLDGLWPCMIRRGFSKSSAALQRLLLSCNYQLRTAVDTSGCKSSESISYFKHLFSRISKSPLTILAGDRQKPFSCYQFSVRVWWLTTHL